MACLQVDAIAWVAAAPHSWPIPHQAKVHDIFPSVNQFADNMPD
jgi:hypothetical protein